MQRIYGMPKKKFVRWICRNQGISAFVAHSILPLAAVVYSRVLVSWSVLRRTLLRKAMLCMLIYCLPIIKIVQIFPICPSIIWLHFNIARDLSKIPKKNPIQVCSSDFSLTVQPMKRAIWVCVDSLDRSLLMAFICAISTISFFTVVLHQHLLLSSVLCNVDPHGIIPNRLALMNPMFR